MTFKRKAVLLLSTMLVSSAIPLLVAPSASAAPSTFYRSCGSSKIANSGEDAYLQSNCRRINGTYRSSLLRLEGLYNDNGVLRFSGGKEAASFQRSCRSVGVNKDVISANCRKRNGKYRRTSIRLNDIHNKDGRLSY